MKNSTDFKYKDNFGYIKFCGVQWEKLTNTGTTRAYGGFLKNKNIGQFYINYNAFQELNGIPGDYYKVISLIHESYAMNKEYAIVGSGEEIHTYTDDTTIISCTASTFLKRFPSNFIDKQMRALIQLYRIYPDYGIKITKLESHQFFARNNAELEFIFNSLKEKKYLSGGNSSVGSSNLYYESWNINITADGFIEIEKQIKKVNSYQVFIAMSFDQKMEKSKMKIKQAIIDSGLDPVVINEVEHINYIPIEIQDKISECGLMVVDLTTQNNGAYFEAGFAMGLKIPVIWCWNKNDDKKPHFDIQQYNNIMYQDEEELYTRLKKRLIAVKNKYLKTGLYD
jgi:nucleoside 2-deoxyribosyltransferase